MLGGADLFLQGFIAPPGGLPSFRAADAAAIVVPGNEFPLAVGVMECDTAQARAADMKVCVRALAAPRIWAPSDVEVWDVCPAVCVLRATRQGVR